MAEIIKFVPKRDNAIKLRKWIEGEGWIEVINVDELSLADRQRYFGESVVGPDKE